ncbi:MAG: M16 family metallopeptidase [Alphaproteobacteria bacterium]
MQAHAQSVFDAKEAILDNGLRIVVVENSRVPVATQMLWYKVGAADELPGKSGIVHFLEHLMFKGHAYPGLGSYEPGEFSRIVRSVGGEDNAFTSQDYTAYYQSVAVEHLEEMMRIEAARMRGLNVSREDVISENKVIREERRQRTDNNPQAQLTEKMKRTLFPVHPYGIPVIGWMEEIETLTWDDAKYFYDQYYTPSNAILIVSGDVTLPQVIAMAERTYGILPTGDSVLVHTRKAAQGSIGPREPIIMEHENVEQPLFRRFYRLPSARQNKRESLALSVLEEILGAPSTGRFYKALVVGHKLAANTSFFYDGSAWDDGTAFFSATPVSADAVVDLRKGVDDVLRNIAEHGPTEEEVNNAIKRLQSRAIYARDSLSGPAMIIGRALVSGQSLDDIETWPEQISRVRGEDVQAVARAYLHPDHLTDTPPVEGILLPKQNIEE